MVEKPTRFTEEEPSLKTGTTRLEFDTQAIRKFATDRSLDVLWEKSYLCPCRNKLTGAPDSSCPTCRGRGIAYLPARKQQVIIQSQEKGVMNMDIGLYDSGTAIGTPQMESGITFRDRISLPDVEIAHSTIFDVTARRIEEGMWLSYDIKKITFATSVEGLLEEETDYTVDIEKNLFFPKEHLLGKNVSLNVTSTLRYIVIDLLKESRYQYTLKNTPQERFESLPKKLLLKREDAWVNPTPFSLESTDTAALEKELEDPKRDMGTRGGGFFGGALNG